jgi:hypothetical protein
LDFSVSNRSSLDLGKIEYISSITRLYGLLRAHQAIIRLADGVAQTGAYGWRTAG